MTCKQIVGQSIHCETAWFSHEGEEFYREGESVEGHLFLECTAVRDCAALAAYQRERALARGAEIGIRVLGWPHRTS